MYTHISKHTGKKKEEEFLAQMGDSMSYSESMSLLKELSVHDSLTEEEKIENFTDRVKGCFSLIFNKINIIGFIYRTCVDRIALSRNRFKKNPNIILKWKKFKQWLCCADATVTQTLESLGGMQGEWRLQRTITAKLKKIRRVDNRITDELRDVRDDFTSDHALCITVFDRVIDSSGLFMLISQYHKFQRGI